MLNPVLVEIAPQLATLVERENMTVVSEMRSPSFGNVAIEVASPKFDLRIARDRGDVFVEISPSGKSEWHSLEHVLDFLGGEPLPDSPGALASSLSKNVEKVARLMASDLERSNFASFEKKESATFLRRIFPHS